MLRWRLLVGLLLIALLVGLVWLDYRASTPGVWLLPLGAVLLVLATSELLNLLDTRGMRPVGLVVQAGNLLIIIAAWLPMALRSGAAAGPCLVPFCSSASTVDAFGCPPCAVGPVVWAAAALALALGMVFLAEVLRFDGSTTACQNLAGGVFALMYLGAMFGLLVHLRMLWGLGALLSLVVVVKLGDIGAYATGRLWGRHKLSPRLSPGKTWEGLAGQLLSNAVGAWFVFTWLVPWTAAGPLGPTAWWRWLVFGLMVGLVGLLGDLAESLIKRSAQRKDSSTWLPGLGGILDVLDSLLLATPAAWLCWAFGLVGGPAGGL